MLKKIDYNEQKQFKQHNHQQYKSNQKTKTGKKTILRTVQRKLTRENLDMANKG